MIRGGRFDLSGIGFRFPRDKIRVRPGRKLGLRRLRGVTKLRGITRLDRGVDGKAGCRRGSRIGKGVKNFRCLFRSGRKLCQPGEFRWDGVSGGCETSRAALRIRSMDSHQGTRLHWARPVIRRRGESLQKKSELLSRHRTSVTISASCGLPAAGRPARLPAAERGDKGSGIGRRRGFRECWPVSAVVSFESVNCPEKGRAKAGGLSEGAAGGALNPA